MFLVIVMIAENLREIGRISYLTLVVVHLYSFSYEIKIKL